MAGNPTDELAGLLVAVQQATLGVISRAVTVLHRDYDGMYEGTYPLILLRLADYSIERLAGGVTGLKGQQGRAQNFYAVEIQDIVGPTVAGGTTVAAAESDIYALIGAIVAYFDHLPNQSLPVNGTPMAYKAGEIIRFRLARPFTAEDGGEVRLVVAGVIGVIGAPHAGSST